MVILEIQNLKKLFPILNFKNFGQFLKTRLMFVKIVNLGIFVPIVDVLFKMKMTSILNQQNVSITHIFVNGREKRNIFLYLNGEFKIQKWNKRKKK
jgi:hypothetical protein